MAAFSKRLGIAAPIILVVVGLALSYTPGVPAFPIPHEWILMGVLPPLLYAAAVNVPVVDFRRNIGAISSLSVFLVLVSAFATGTLLYLLLPDLNFAAAVALGAVVSPPDAVAATSIGKRLGLPPRLVTVLNWRTISFLLENGVFLLMGLELRHLVDNADSGLLSVGDTVLIGLAVTVLLILIRFAWVTPLMYLLRAKVSYQDRRTQRIRLGLDRLKARGLTDERKRKRHRRAELLYLRRRADIEQLRREGLGWRGGVVISWSGMRGVVTLAAAQSLPGQTPYHEQLVLIAFTVAVATLLLQGGTLPWLIRILDVQGRDVAEDQRELAKLLDELSGAGLSILERPEECLGARQNVDPDVVERVRQSTFLRSELAWERVRVLGMDEDPTPQLQYRQLRRAVVDAERDQLLLVRREGRFPSRTLAEAQRLLDLEESRLRPRLGER